MAGQSDNMSEALRTKASGIPCHTTTVMKTPVVHQKTTQQKIPQKMENFMENTHSAPLRPEASAGFVYSGCTRLLKSIHKKTKVINAWKVIRNLLFPCQILTLWRFTACPALITETVAQGGKGRKDWKRSTGSNSRP